MTYIVKLKKSSEVIRLPDDRGQIVKEKWWNEDGDTKIDLGSWSGRLQNIDCILYEADTKITTDEEQARKYYLTPEEKKRADTARERVGKFLRERWAKQADKSGHNISYMNPLSDNYDGGKFE